MPLSMTNYTLLSTNAAIDLYGASPISFSCWIRKDPAFSSWSSPGNLFYYSDNDSWFDCDGSHFFIDSKTHTTSNYEIYTWPGAAVQTNHPYHFVYVTGDGSQTVYIDGVLTWSYGNPGSEGYISTSGNRALKIGTYNGGAFSLQDIAIWSGHRITQAEAKALRDRTSTPAQIGAAGTLKWWLTLAGTEGHAPTIGDASLTDQSASGLNIISISGSPTYNPTSFSFEFPSFIASAKTNPTRDAIILFFKDLSNNQVNPVGPNIVNPTLTINGGTPVALTNPIWGVSGSYQPWIHYKLAAAVQPTDTLVLNAADPWISTTAGPVADLINYPVDNAARSTLLPPFVANSKTMEVGYDSAKPPIYYSVVPVYSNLAKQIDGWYNASVTFDSNNVPTQIAAGGTLLANVVSAQYDRTTNDKLTCTACPSGIWSVMWDGQATDSGTPLLNLSSGGTPGTSISAYGVDSLPGTTNNQRKFQIVQDQSIFWSPTVYLDVRGRADGGSFSPPLSNIRIYPPDPANTATPLSDASPKFHPTYLAAITGAKCLRFSLAASSGGIVDFSDFLPVGMLGYSMAGRSYGGSITRIDPYTDNEGSGGAPYFGNSATAKLTFSAPHNAKDGDILRAHTVGPNSDDSFPLTAAAPNDHGWISDQGANDFAGTCRYNPATMANNELVYTFNTPTSLTGPCTLTQGWTQAGVNKGAWYTRSDSCYVTPGIPPAECCAQANAVGADIWISISYNVTDACIAALMGVVAQQLNSGRKIYLEYSNEVWNTGFQGYRYCSCNGRLAGLGPLEWYTLRASQVHQQAYTALQANSPPRGGDLVRVFGVQGANVGGTTRPITIYAAANSIPIDVISPAPYVENSVSPFIGPGGGESSQIAAYDACTADQLMDLGELFIQYGAYEAYITSHQSYVGPGTSFPNTKIACYEGGPEGGYPAYGGYYANPMTSLTDGAKIERVQIWCRHPRMRGIMLHFLQLLQNSNCVLFNDYLVASGGEFTGGALWQAYYTWNMKAGMGDGSDGLGDNRLYSFPATVPFQDYGRLVSVVGGAINYWNSLVGATTDNGSVISQTASPFSASSWRTRRSIFPRSVLSITPPDSPGDDLGMMVGRSMMETWQ